MGFAPIQRRRFSILQTSEVQDKSTIIATTLKAEATASSPSKPIFDPLGLYPEDSPECINGYISPLESTVTQSKEIFDPLRLYADQSQVSQIETSQSLPFLPRPALLDGTLPGDRGFDPLSLASDASALYWQRKAEIKHARLAMLACVGWPVAELLHKSIAETLHLPSLLASLDRVPSVLNDGLLHSSPLFWVEAVTLAAMIEIPETLREDRRMRIDPADNGFDPLGLYENKSDEQKFFLREAELFNGRLGMLAIVGFAIQEWYLKSAVVDQIPIFFKPLNVAFEQLMN